MKILIISQYFWPESFKINDIAEYLGKCGHEVEVLTGIPNYPEGKYYKGYGVFKRRREEYKGINIKRVLLLPRGKGQSDKRLIPNYISYVVNGCISVFGMRRTHYDAALVFEVSPITQAYPAIFLKKLAKTPICMYIYDLWPDTLFSHGFSNSGIKRFLLKRCKNIYNSFDKLFITSKGFEQRLIEYGYKSENIEYIPQWVESRYKPVDATNKVRERFAIKATNFMVMFAGNLGFAQAIDIIIKAAECLKQNESIKFVFVGDGTEKQWCKDECGNKGINNCFFMERQSADDMPGILAEADSLLVTLKDRSNYSLTLPGRLQSFMACRKPLIVCANGETARVVEEARAGLTCPAEDADKLSECISKMAAMSEEELNLFGENGYRYACRNFDESTLLKKIEE